MTERMKKEDDTVEEMTAVLEDETVVDQAAKGVVRPDPEEEATSVAQPQATKKTGTRVKKTTKTTKTTKPKRTPRKRTTKTATKTATKTRKTTKTPRKTKAQPAGTRKKGLAKKPIGEKKKPFRKGRQQSVSTDTEEKGILDEKISEALQHPFIQRLLDEDLLTPSLAESFFQSARRQGVTFFRMVMDHPSVRRERDLPQIAASYLGLPEPIDNVTILMSKALVSDWLPFDLCNLLGVILLKANEPDTVHFGVLDPFDITIDDLIIRNENVLPEQIRKTVVMPDVFALGCRKLYQRSQGDRSEEVGLPIIVNIKEKDVAKQDFDNIPVPELVDYFLYRAYSKGASDIHIEPTESRLLVRNRVDGVLHEEQALSMMLHPEICSRIKIMCGMNVAEKRRPQDNRIGIVIDDISIDIRVSTYPTVYGEKIVMRLLDQNALLPSIDLLGLLKEDEPRLKDKINAPYGLIMISGPTGAGKTTTLYSCLSDIDKKGKNALTIEDPVEYRLDGVHQMQVNDKIGLTFAKGLRTILRQDPDVVMVGECRDKETAEMAVHAALTGHIVFSTIHANDSVGVITRLLDLKIAPFLVATALTMAMAQRLVRKICPACKTSVSGKNIKEELWQSGVSPKKITQLGLVIKEDYTYAQGSGCFACNYTGYKGRQAVYELFEITSKVRAAILSPDINADKLRQLAKEDGMTTLLSHGLTLIEKEVTTFEEIVRVLGESY